MSQYGICSTSTTPPIPTLQAFGQVYNQSSQNFNNGTHFTFDSNGPLVNISHTAGSDTITIGISGFYLIRWMLNMFGSGGNITLLKNGVVVSIGSFVTDVGATEPIGEAIVACVAGDTIQLRNDTGLPLSTNFSAGYTNMSMTFEKLTPTSGGIGGATSFPTNAGTANEAGGVLNVLGGTGITTSGAGNTVTISATGTTTLTYTNVNTTPYVVLPTDEYLSVDCSGGPITIELPNAAPNIGRCYVIKDRTGFAALNNITVKTVSGLVNIEGAGIYTINTARQALEVIYSGTAYEAF